ncbi:hypothetical protein [Sulfitobacter sp. S190]|uniref:hypothetical protein n=1 Tax=Sulfitobacter sp. S190 TaxID=2867022 RepID=UPI0021A457C0|nr:hypothetical protein [Sulfitobacter sp. S190]UWR21713.1 hypothetical protein K3756_13605 [Sulfitobacter sp. S190]
MKKLIYAVSLAGLAACGVDGEPVQPSGGVTVVLTNSGSHIGGGVGLSRGPVTLGVGF